MKRVVIGLMVMLFSAGAWSNEAAIRQVLETQRLAWNRGDIPGYMQGYWHSDQLRFISGGKIKYGWDTTLRGYLKRYPDAAAMGQLQFELETVQMLAEDVALVVGRWMLLREKDKPAGEFTLIVRKLDGQWRIVHDHTS
ncbi:DUF4440 domain-containing protein [Ferrimonas sediminicola]|uniref:DUF4440 domain-containing protein n=1 Tax=Ferrimonas sediminicola TaxID=2569538 RepID=A0A4U1B6S2_9GAMM|nr:DUF4440 domain-containing protein [Ferrimonas sediminicola]TKB46235.1 DUF4440 domain-containing protein [Ferrimonas sediminicola]